MTKQTTPTINLPEAVRLYEAACRRLDEAKEEARAARQVHKLALVGLEKAAHTAANGTQEAGR